MCQTKFGRHVWLLFALVGLTNCAASEPPPLGVVTRVNVERIVDGDTVDVIVAYRVRERLSDCWAPEKNTPAGERASEMLREYALGKPAILHVPTDGARSMADVLTLNRVVGSVWLRGEKESLSEYQVRNRNASTRKGLELGK